MLKILLILLGISFNLFQLGYCLKKTTDVSNAFMDLQSIDFESYLEYRKLYKNDILLNVDIDELKLRYEIFKSNIEKILNHNKDNSKNYILGLNQFTDMTLEELSLKYLDFSMLNHLKLNQSKSSKELEKTKFFLAEETTIRDINTLHFNPIDWREQDLFLPVRDQGECGSCWAFASVGTVEALRYKNFSIKKYLSPQQLLDCDTKDKGCKGGWPSIAYNYIYSNGIVSEEDYPYKALSETCHSDLVKSNVEAKIQRKINTCEEDECITNDYQYNLLKNGPIAVVIDAYHSNFFNYESGYYDESCSEPNHAIILVGVGFDNINNIQYWIIRNSWGNKWGMNGYGYVKHNLKNVWSCNINRYAFQPIVTE